MFSTPKTNWVATGKFNTQDYNRIKNNITHLWEMSIELYGSSLNGLVDMGPDATYNDLPYADMINALENNLQTITTNTIKIDIGPVKQFNDNDVFIDNVELNRLESGIKELYELLTGQLNGRPRLGFKLGKRRVV